MLDSLQQYIKNNKESEIIDLISANPDILNQKNKSGSSGFFLIAYSGLVSAFEKAKALKQSFDFHEAIIVGALDTVRNLIHKNKGLVNVYSNDGFSPLSLAAFFNQVEITSELLKHHANPNIAAKNPSKVNALHAAIAKENLKICKLLLKYGVDVNATQMNNVTALHSATHRGNLDLIKLLVTNGAKIDLKMDNGHSALFIAKNEGHHQIVSFLEQLN